MTDDSFHVVKARWADWLLFDRVPRLAAICLRFDVEPRDGLGLRFTSRMQELRNRRVGSTHDSAQQSQQFHTFVEHELNECPPDTKPLLARLYQFYEAVRTGNLNVTADLVDLRDFASWATARARRAGLEVPMQLASLAANNPQAPAKDTESVKIAALEAQVKSLQEQLAQRIDAKLAKDPAPECADAVAEKAPRTDVALKFAAIIAHKFQCDPRAGIDRQTREEKHDPATGAIRNFSQTIGAGLDEATIRKWMRAAMKKYPKAVNLPEA